MTSGDPHRNGGESARDIVERPYRFAGQLETTHTRNERLEHRKGFESGQVLPGATVIPEAESEMVHGIPIDVEDVRVLIVALVAIG